MPSVSVERLPVQLLGLGLLGFDHLQIVFQTDLQSGGRQDDWFVIEGLREQDGIHARLTVEGWHGGTTLSDANGGLVGDDLVERIGTSASRGAQTIASGREAAALWATLVSHAADIEAQSFPYIPMALPSSPLPTINSSSLVASLLHHAGVDIEEALPSGLRLSPGMATLLGTSGDDMLRSGARFSTLVGGGGDDVLIGSDDARVVDKLYGGAGNDTFRWSRGVNIFHGGQPGLDYADDGTDTVDYSGAGDIRIDALSAGAPHRQPDFVVTHAGGRDYLFSIEEILWDGARDRVTLGTGVGLAAPLPFEADPERLDRLPPPDEPMDLPPGLGLFLPGAFDDGLPDSLFALAEFHAVDPMGGG